MKNGHGIGNIHNLLIFGNLGDEIAGRQIITDGHTNTEDQDIRIDTKKLVMNKFVMITFSARVFV